MSDDLDRNPEPAVKRLNGFASMPQERQKEIARMGQAALKASGRRHHWNSESARAAAMVGWARRKEAKA
jgi:hypothetical protein